MHVSLKETTLGWKSHIVLPLAAHLGDLLLGRQVVVEGYRNVRMVYGQAIILAQDNTML